MRSSHSASMRSCWVTAARRRRSRSSQAVIGMANAASRPTSTASREDDVAHAERVPEGVEEGLLRPHGRRRGRRARAAGRGPAARGVGVAHLAATTRRAGVRTEDGIRRRRARAGTRGRLEAEPAVALEVELGPGVGVARPDDVALARELTGQEADRHARRDALCARQHDHRRCELHAVAASGLVEVLDRLEEASLAVAKRLAEVERVGVAARVAQVVLDRDRLVERVVLALGDLGGPLLDQVARAVGDGEVVVGDVGGVRGAGLAQLRRRRCDVGVRHRVVAHRAVDADVARHGVDASTACPPAFTSDDGVRSGDARCGEGVVRHGDVVLAHLVRRRERRGVVGSLAGGPGDAPLPARVVRRGEHAQGSAGEGGRRVGQDGRLVLVVEAAREVERVVEPDGALAAATARPAEPLGEVARGEVWDDGRHEERDDDADGAELERPRGERAQGLAVVRGLVDLALVRRVGGAPAAELGASGRVQHDEPQHDGHDEVAQRERGVTIGRRDEVGRQQGEPGGCRAAPRRRHGVDRDRDERDGDDEAEGDAVVEGSGRRVAVDRLEGLQPEGVGGFERGGCRHQQGERLAGVAGEDDVGGDEHLEEHDETAGAGEPPPDESETRDEEDDEDRLRQPGRLDEEARDRVDRGHVASAARRVILQRRRVIDCLPRWRP